MSLETSYEVLEMLRDDGVQTFRAKEKSTGRGLELHLFLPFGRPENKVLFDRLKSLPLDSRGKLLDVGLDGSTPYVVTDPLPGNRSFKSWAEELIAGPPQEAPSGFNAAFASAPPSRDDGVQILQAGQWRTGTPIPDSLVTKPLAPPPAPPRQQQPTAAPSDGGDFTRMFQAPAFLTQNAPPPAPPEKQASAQPAGEFTGFFQSAESAPTIPESMNASVGEFTGLFQARPPATPISSVMPPAVEGAGEFTRMFQAPGNLSAPPPDQAPVRNSGGAEFTKYFENPLKPGPLSAQQPINELPPPPPPPPTAGKRAGDFTEVFGSRPASPQDSPGSQSPPPGPAFGAMPSATGAFSAPPLWSQPQTQPTFQAGPSEYTKMMSSPPVAPGSGPSVFAQGPGAAAQLVPAPKKSNTVLYIAIGVVVLLIIGIIVFLMMRGQPVTIPATK